MTSSSLPDLGALSPLAPALASTIASLAGDIALVLDRDGVIRSVAASEAPLSPACVGWVGRHWIETATADTRPKLEKLLAEVREGGVAHRREVNHPAPEGDAIPVAWSALRLGDSGAVIAVGRDLRAVAAIQQRFLDTQQELERTYWRRRQDESRDRQLQHLANDALLVLDAASLRLLEANEAALALLQHAHATAIGRALTELLAPTARAAVGDLLAGARSSGRAGEIRLRLAEREPPMGVAATPFRGLQGHCLLVRARREGPPDDAAVSAAAAAGAVLVVDSVARVQTANAAALQYLQLTTEAQLQGRALADVVHADDAPSWAGLVERARREGLVTRAPIGPDVGGAAILVTAALMTEGEQECISLVWQPHGALLQPASTPADILKRLAAQLGQAPLPALLAQARQEAERHLIAVALWRAGGSQPEAARLLGVSVEQLAQRMQRLGLPAPGAVK